MSKKNVFAFAFVGLLGFAVACASQGEGDRCNSDDDCSGTLTCVTKATFTDTSTRVCCPLGSDSTNALCKGGDTNITNPDASGVVDGLDADVATDAGNDSEASSSSSSSSSSGEVDASSDAASDADGS